MISRKMNNQVKGYQPKPKAEAEKADNRYRDLHYSGYHKKSNLI